MAYQNINQYVYNKWYLSPVREVTDISLASDESQFNEEVVFSTDVIGSSNGNVLPVKIDLNFSGSNQGFNLIYQNYNFDNILISSNYYNPYDITLDCFSSQTICDIGLTGTDNGLVTGMTGQSITYMEGLLPTADKFNRLDFDRRFKMHQVTGYTWSPNERFSGVTAGTYYNIVSYTANTIGTYHELYGGFYQGFYKLFGYPYEVLPTRYPKGWTVEMTLKPRFVDVYVPPVGATTLNDYYPNNSGIFFYMGTRAENKYWHHAAGENPTDTGYTRVTQSLTGLSSCMCSSLNPGYTTVSYTEFDLSQSGATISIPANLSWSAGDQILVYHDPLQYVIGNVVNYSASTGELQFIVTKRVGKGNFQAWVVDQPDYLDYALSNCVLVYPPTGYTDYHNVVCSCCNPNVQIPLPERPAYWDSISNAFAIRFSGDPRNPKICVRTLTFTGDCQLSGSCETLGFESVTGYSINNYCSDRGIYDDVLNFCSGTTFDDVEHWVLIDAVFERYSWFDFCDLYWRGGLGVITTDVYTATTANRSISLIEPPTTHYQLIPEKEEFVQLNYEWLLERFYRVGKLKLYVNGKHFQTFDDFEEIIPRGLFGHKETQVGVPFNLSWGGGTQGLHENLIFSAIPTTTINNYIQDPELFPDVILSATSLSALTTDILIEQNFAGSFDGGISTFHMYAKPLSVPEIQHNARILAPIYDLTNPYCLDCDFVDNCDIDFEFSAVTPTLTPSVTPTISLTPSHTPTNSPTPTLTPTNTAFATPTPTPSVTTTITNTQTPNLSPSPTTSITPSVTSTSPVAIYGWDSTLLGCCYGEVGPGINSTILLNVGDVVTINGFCYYIDQLFGPNPPSPGPLPIVTTTYLDCPTCLSSNPCLTRTPTPTPTVTKTPNLPVFTDCLILGFEGPVYYLPPLGIIGNRPYFEGTTPFGGSYPFRIFYDDSSSTWNWINLLNGIIVQFMASTSNYPDSTTGVWVGLIPPFYSTTSTFQGPCSFPPPNTPTPSETSNCCSTYEVESGSSFDPFASTTIEYLDCEGDLQQYIFTASDGPITILICAKNNSITVVSGNLFVSWTQVEECGCTLGTTPTPTPSQTPTNTPTISNTPTKTPTSTQTPTKTPTNTPTPSITPSITPTITPSQVCCSTWELYSTFGGTYTYVDCENVSGSVTLSPGGTLQLCAKVVVDCEGCNSYISTSCECCTTVESTSITNSVLDTPNASSFSRGSVSVGLSTIGGGIYALSGSATKSTGNVTVVSGGDLGTANNCQEGAVEVTAFVPSSISGASGYRTKIQVYHNASLLGTVYSGYNPVGSNVTQIFTYTRNSGDNINIIWDSEN